MKCIHGWFFLPSQQAYAAYAQHIEDSGKKAAFAAKGKRFEETLHATFVRNMKHSSKGYIPTSGHWPAGEIDEVANRYIEYTISADKKKGMVIESIVVPVFVKGGHGMNMHINYGFGEDFKDVTTIYENTALPKSKPQMITLDQPILIPAGQTLHIRILPWYDSNGKPQKGKYLQLGELKVIGKKLQ